MAATRGLESLLFPRKRRGSILTRMDFNRPFCPFTQKPFTLNEVNFLSRKVFLNLRSIPSAVISKPNIPEKQDNSVESTQSSSELSHQPQSTLSYLSETLPPTPEAIPSSLSVSPPPTRPSDQNLPPTPGNSLQNVLLTEDNSVERPQAPNNSSVERPRAPTPNRALDLQGALLDLIESPRFTPETTQSTSDLDTGPHTIHVQKSDPVQVAPTKSSMSFIDEDLGASHIPLPVGYQWKWFSHKDLVPHPIYGEEILSDSQFSSVRIMQIGDKDVIVKFFKKNSETSLKEVIREADTALYMGARGIGPEVVGMVEPESHRGLPALIMKHVPNSQDMFSMMNRRMHVPRADILDLLVQTARLLGDLHKHGFVHNNVKITNILITPNELHRNQPVTGPIQPSGATGRLTNRSKYRVYLLDFGQTTYRHGGEFDIPNKGSIKSFLDVYSFGKSMKMVTKLMKVGSLAHDLRPTIKSCMQKKPSHRPKMAEVEEVLQFLKNNPSTKSKTRQIAMARRRLVMANPDTSDDESDGCDMSLLQHITENNTDEPICSSSEDTVQETKKLTFFGKNARQHHLRILTPREKPKSDTSTHSTTTEGSELSVEEADFCVDEDLLVSGLTAEPSHHEPVQTSLPHVQPHITPPADTVSADNVKTTSLISNITHRTSMSMDSFPDTTSFSQEERFVSCTNIFSDSTVVLPTQCAWFWIERSDVLPARVDVGEALSDGTFSYVYLMWYKNRDIIVKAFKNGGVTDLESVISEADIATLMGTYGVGPSVAGVLDNGPGSCLPAIAMESLPSASDLYDLIQNESLSRMDILDMFAQAARMLSFIHQRSFVHNDVKLTNLLVVPNNGEQGVGLVPPPESACGYEALPSRYRVFLIDFGETTHGHGGCFELSGEDLEAHEEYPYLPPEVINGALTEGSSDVYSFGMAMKLAISMVNSESLAMDLYSLVGQCLHTDKDLRPSMESVEGVLQHLIRAPIVGGPVPSNARADGENDDGDDNTGGGPPNVSSQGEGGNQQNNITPLGRLLSQDNRSRSSEDLVLGMAENVLRRGSRNILHHWRSGTHDPI